MCFEIFFSECKKKHSAKKLFAECKKKTLGKDVLASARKTTLGKPPGTRQRAGLR